MATGQRAAIVDRHRRDSGYNSPLSPACWVKGKNAKRITQKRQRALTHALERSALITIEDAPEPVEVTADPVFIVIVKAPVFWRNYEALITPAMTRRKPSTSRSLSAS